MAFNEFEESSLADDHHDDTLGDQQYDRRNGLEIPFPQDEDELDVDNDKTVNNMLMFSPHGDELAEDPPTPQLPPMSRSASSKITRTVAIIKTHALEHRFEVEAKIQESGFEIVKERQMVFDTETDPETLEDLFGEDAAALAEGPVWVYVLERHRAVEVWSTLIGDRDPAIASPNTLRGRYGLSPERNGFMGSPNVEIAEIQIASLFASSPPFPTTELPGGSERFDSLRSVTSSVLEELRQHTQSDSYAASTATETSTAGGESRSTKSGGGRTSGRPSFRARELPVTHIEPDIKPRMSRAAALRAGMPVEKVHVGPRAPPTKERLAQTFANVPGHKRTETIPVASTAAPTIAPRMTRAASLRLGLTPPAPANKPRPSSVAAKAKTVEKKASDVTFEGVPGHKRRESISVASSKPPTVAPRINKSAALRQHKEAAPPSSFMFKGPTEPVMPGLSRRNSISSINQISRPASQSSIRPSPQSRPISRPASTLPNRPPSATPKPLVRPTTNNVNANGKAHTPLAPVGVNGTEKSEPAPPKRKPRPSSLMAPMIAPRPNKSAMLRAAKMEAQNAAAAKKAPRKKVGPANV